MNNILRKYILIGILLLVTGCGYYVAGGPSRPGGPSQLDDPSGPGRISSLSIPVFENRTGRPDVESVVTGALVDEFKTTVRIAAPGEAEVVLAGVIKSYALRPVSFTELDVAREYRLTVVMSVRLVSEPGGEELWKDDNITDYEDFLVDPTSVIATKDSEWEALKKLARDRARIIKERILLQEAFESGP